ncbi:MAG: S1-like domain-containing RNA-binding protein [Crocinitomicaceae bacterium]|nr:S1-like domain-containing RNA-binding protein [Crocinitomicaceae bacterium]
MKIGEFNELTLLRFTSVGAYLADDEDNDVLLPNKYLTDDMGLDDLVEVFVYRDSEDRAVATTEEPYIEMNGYAYLKVTSVNHFGAFVDWGLEKELMIPFKEQNLKLEEDRYYLTRLMLDESTDRVIGSTRVQRYLEECTKEYDPNEEVDIMICDITDLGVKVIVEERYSGLIFNSNISRKLGRGELTKGYVSLVREDGKLDVLLDKVGFEKIDESAERLLDILKKKGQLSITDKSDPETIRETVGMSKKTFKKAVGSLYKQRLIVLEKDRICLVESGSDRD